jgi:hypothetical protein
MSQRALDLDDSLNKRPKLTKMDMRFGMWNVRSLYGEDSLMTVAKEIWKYKLRSDGAEMAVYQQTNIHSSMERGMRIMN